ncbi:hypothetical protein PLESTB_001280900 [Pleodorina starrii]|uniref:Uncharacterized protein n=1 Tax=Pleodorina starrii TaxID=330485 RepID=A0A9W6F619_9CHLO|nr:hypothetical protein PLESTB_001280900 [Pleodorina starrii]GLC69921.1 hypothetical protein PLESTF_000898600 [Pleodorina starrii]
MASKPQILQQTARYVTLCKERLFNGSIRYLPQEQEIEYRKRFQLFGLAPAYAWARWDLRRLSSSGWGSDSLPALKPRLGFGLGLGGSSPLLLFGGGLRTAGALLSQGGPLSYSFKTSVGSVPGLRAKGYVDLSVPLPLSFGDDAPGSEAASIDGDRWGGYDTPTGGGYSSYSRRSDSGSGAVRLLLRKTALVLTL